MGIFSTDSAFGLYSDEELRESRKKSKCNCNCNHQRPPSRWDPIPPWYDGNPNRIDPNRKKTSPEVWEDFITNSLWTFSNWTLIPSLGLGIVSFLVYTLIKIAISPNENINADPWFIKYEVVLGVIFGLGVLSAILSNITDGIVSNKIIYEEKAKIREGKVECISCQNYVEEYQMTDTILPSTGRKICRRCNEFYSDHK